MRIALRAKVLRIEAGPVAARNNPRKCSRLLSFPSFDLARTGGGRQEKNQDRYTDRAY